MALSSATHVFTRAVVAAAGTSVSPSTACPDNCVSMILLNRSTNTVLFRRGTAGSAISDDGTCGILLASSALTVPVGVLSERVEGTFDPSTVAASGWIFDMDAGSGTISIIYVCVGAGAAARARR